MCSGELSLKHALVIDLRRCGR